MSYPRISLFSLLSLSVLTLCIASSVCWAQTSHSEQLQVRPPLMRMVDPPAQDATVADLEQRADELRVEKLYLDALDYYHAAMAKEKNSARLMNKVGITELMMQRYRDAKKSFEQSIKADHGYADAYNNLGVVYYEQGRYGPAVKQYRRAIAVDGTSASFYNNLGAAFFARKEIEQAVTSYQKAMELDPDVFERSSRGGVQAQLPGPEDHAYYDYLVARLYAMKGSPEKSLEYLRKAREEGYKDFKNVYKDVEFSAVRKDPRFAQMMAEKNPALD
jgi:tetratricopeptide (TPR) repeat protein